MCQGRSFEPEDAGRKEGSEWSLEELKCEDGGWTLGNAMIGRSHEQGSLRQTKDKFLEVFHDTIFRKNEQSIY